MIRPLKFLSGLLLAAALAACGGGGGSPGGTPSNPGGGTTAPVPASIEVLTLSPELTSAPNSSLTFVVVAKDANNQAIPNQTVTFSATSGNLTGSLPAPAQGANGEPITSVSLTPGADRSNRTITVTVSAGGVSRQITVPVVGTSVAISGDSSMLVGGQTTLTARAVDSAGQPIPNATLTVSSSRGNSLSATSLTTNSQGAATVTYRGTNAGQDTITVTGLGATSSTSILVSSDEFRFESPSASSSIMVGATQTVTVRSLVGGVPQVGQPVTFSTTRGTITPASTTTDSTGRASAVISSSSSGPASIVAQVASAQVTLPVSYVATVASTLVLQANPGALAPNSAGSTTNQSTLIATVRDASGNPVSGRTVNFTALTDPSNGTISPGTATTDAAGNAQAQFIAGPIATANNGVQLQATVAGTSISGTAVLTVNSQALFISIGTGNVISNFDPQTYEKEFSVYVTDANGAPAGNRVVNLEILPYEYLKGSLVYLTQWTYDLPTISVCNNEDTNRNGILNAGEDFNGNGRLEPGIPVIVVPGSVTTSNAGLATFRIRYGENFSLWVRAEITARASVGGTESTKSLRLTLPASSEDLSNENVPPASVVSPFGINSCGVAN